MNAALLILLALGSQPETAPADLGPAIERAISLLVEMQESLDGEGAISEWPYEGVYRVGGEIPIGYRVGGTAIGAWALMEAPGYAERDDARAAVERATEFVLTGLEHELMASGFKGGYDVRGWGHTYALQMFLRMHAQGFVPDGLEARVAASITWLVRTLEETEIKQAGGWNYSRRNGYEKPGPASPFMTAPTLIALYEARRQGHAVDDAVVTRALDALENCRGEEGAVPYTTAGGRDEMPGATGRTPITEVVLFLAGRSDEERIRHAVDGFLEHWEWLEKRRRQNGTHVAPYGIAPYYFFYAHGYAALAIEFLPADEREIYRNGLLKRLFQVREPSGGWNDRVFDRSENYGTAMSLLALLMPGLEKPCAWQASVAATR